MIVAVLEQAPVHIGPYEWGTVVLASAIIFFFLGPKLLKDLKKK